MTPEEIAMLNSDTVHDSRDRSFCGIELGPLTLINRRYIERLMAKFGQAGYGPKEISFAYAYILTLPLAQLRVAARDLDVFESGMDEFIEKLPKPVPQSEMKQLEGIVSGDIEAIKAATVELAPKPGQSSDPDEPKNS